MDMDCIFWIIIVDITLFIIVGGCLIVACHKEKDIDPPLLYV